MRKKPSSVLITAYLKYRREGLAPKQALEKARKSAARLKQMRKTKQMGFGSKEALREAKSLSSAKHTQSLFLRINPKFKISLMEAISLDLLCHDAVRSFNITPEDFFRAYAEIRFSEKRKGPPETRKELAGMAIQAIERLKGKQSKKMLTKIKYSSHILPAAIISLGVDDFFFRLKAEGEKSLHKTENERNGLELTMIDFINAKDKKKLVKSLVLKTLKNMKAPLTLPEFEAIIERIPDFARKPQPAQERIVQEMRTSALGEKIAPMIEKYCRDLREGMQFFHKTNYREVYDWVISCLKRPGNRKFVAQKAIEWFGRKK